MAAATGACVAMQATGEGKTLVATLPAYLNGLAGHGAFVVTANDYLARRDAELMGQVHRYGTATRRRRRGQGIHTYMHALGRGQGEGVNSCRSRCTK